MILQEDYKGELPLVKSLSEENRGFLHNIFNITWLMINFR